MVCDDTKKSLAIKSKEIIEPLWREPHGDRQQAMVMIGQQMDIPAMEKALNKCLLTDEEYAKELKSGPPWPIHLLLNHAKWAQSQEWNWQRRIIILV